MIRENEIGKVNFCAIPTFTPKEKAEFLRLGPEFYRTTGHLLRAWKGFKTTRPEAQVYREYWLDIYKGSVRRLDELHRQIEQKSS